MQISTNDFYEAAYCLLSGCELVEIEGSRVNGKIICRFVLSGGNIGKLQLDYLNGKATANILDLRRMIGQIHAWVSTARRKIKNQLREAELRQGGVV